MPFDLVIQPTAEQIAINQRATLSILNWIDRAAAARHKTVKEQQFVHSVAVFLEKTEEEQTPEEFDQKMRTMLSHLREIRGGYDEMLETEPGFYMKVVRKAIIELVLDCRERLDPVEEALDHARQIAWQHGYQIIVLPIGQRNGDSDNDMPSNDSEPAEWEVSELDEQEAPELISDKEENSELVSGEQENSELVSGEQENSELVSNEQDDSDSGSVWHDANESL